MPRPSKGARLYLYHRPGREAVYIIRDGEHQERTGCGRGDPEGASRALEAYLKRKHRPTGSSAPSEVPVADALNLYLRNKTPEVVRPDMLLCTVRPLLEWWGHKYVADVKGVTCRAYVAWRVGQPIHVRGDRKTKRTVQEASARRELETLRAAINHYHAEHTLDAVPVVTIPAKAPSRERWLTRDEVARLLKAAWREPGARHLARFILIGIYTGTRHDAILRLSWMPTTQGGWIDIEKGVLYRRAAGERETKKRRPPARIPRRLMAHLRRWYAQDIAAGIPHVIHVPIGKERREANPDLPAARPVRKERRAWHTARVRADLGPDVIPHIMRHTAATWLMQAGPDKWEAAGFLGMTLKQLEDTYGHHHPDFQSQISEVF